LRFQTNNNPGGLIDPRTGAAQDALEKNIVTVTKKDDVAYNNIQFYDTGTAIRNRSVIDYDVAPTLDNVTVQLSEQM